MLSLCWNQMITFLFTSFYPSQGEGQWLWGVNEVQEADQRPEVRSEPDP